LKLLIAQWNQHLPVLERLKLKKLAIKTQLGLGDNIYQRPFIKALSKTHELYLQTPWPQLYSDLKVKFIPAATNLRTQSKNIARKDLPVEYVTPVNIPMLEPRYVGEDLKRGTNMVESLKKAYKCEPESFDLPKFNTIKINTKKPICIIRPATIRQEWIAASRNPDPNYLLEASRILRKKYYVISVADIDNLNEIGVDPLPEADLYFNTGELTAEQVLGLIQKADLVVGGVGFIVPACIATKTKLFCILGGNGGYNSPELIIDARMDLSNVYFCKPDNFCKCTSAIHNCDKRISNFNDQLEGFCL